MTIRRLKPGARMSQAVAHGGALYLAGQVADDTKADVRGQTQQILAKIDRLLAEAGTDKTKLLSANIWLADMSSFAAMNEVWDAWVAQGHTPARATVESKLAGPQYLVEIGGIAALD
jgi:enamine deaminase RidA (YjgF/YER057c/UK114 family)